MTRSTAKDMTWIKTDELAALRAEVAQVEEHRVTLKDMLLRETRKLEEARLAHIKTAAELRDALDEIARLTPRMVRELPMREGWYWRKHWDCLAVVRVFVEAGFWVYVAIASNESFGIWEDDNVLWSAEPITMPVIQKEGE